MISKEGSLTLSDPEIPDATLEGIRPDPQDRTVKRGTPIHNMSEVVVCAPVEVRQWQCVRI